MRICGVLAIGLAAALLAGCGGGSGAETAEAIPKVSKKDQEITVGMNGWEGPESAGILMAERRGFFADAGFSQVLTLVPVNPLRSVKNVVNGADDISVSYAPQVVLAKEKGAPIVIVGSLVRQPTAAMIWLKRSQIGGVADLRGKTIAIPDLPFQKEFLRSVLARGGLTLGDVKVKRVGYKLVSALVSGRADAIFGGSWNLEGAELESRGLKPVITRARNLGLPPYDEIVLIARADRVAEDPQMIRAFTAAIIRGTAAAVKSPKSTVDAIESGVESNPEADRKTTEAEVEATLPLLSASGYTNPVQMRHLVDWMHEQGMIEGTLPVSKLLTNDFVTRLGN
jgi:ABC-type nitrate/sulfonate/bicarbonate transport system substrate-binding protein